MISLKRASRGPCNREIWKIYAPEFHGGGAFNIKRMFADLDGS